MNGESNFKPGVKYEFNKKPVGIKVSESKYFVQRENSKLPYSTFINKTIQNSRSVIKYKDGK